MEYLLRGSATRSGFQASIENIKFGRGSIQIWERLCYSTGRTTHVDITWSSGSCEDPETFIEMLHFAMEIKSELMQNSQEYIDVEEARKKKNEEWQKEYDAMDEQKELFEKRHPGCRVLWSLGKTKLSDIAVKGSCVFNGGNWAGNKKEYVSQVQNNPTWETVAELADAMLVHTNNQHHVFLEGIELVDSVGTPIPEGSSTGIPQYRLIMGS